MPLGRTFTRTVLNRTQSVSKRVFAMSKKSRQASRNTYKNMFREGKKFDASKVKRAPAEKIDYIKRTREVIENGRISRFVKKVYDKRNSRVGKALRSTVMAGPRVGMSMMNVVTRNPIKIAAGAGVGFGILRGTMDSNMRTQHMKKPRSMAPNHLGTDGLTLNLSRIRHR